MALNVPAVTDIRLPREAGKGSPLCGLIAATEEGYARCRACDRLHHARAATTGKPLLYTCHAGFLDLAVPILVDGRHVGTISSGQLLPEPPSAESAARLRRRIGDLPISGNAYMAAYTKALYLPRSRIRAVMRFIEVFVGELGRSARRIRDLEARLERSEIQRARHYIEQHFRGPELTLGAVAAASSLSPAHFSHVFRMETGETFTHFVQRRRIMEGKLLLERTDWSITKICFACGFSNLTHFNRVFRRFENCSPRQYRAF
jgi:AraC-like DNA-binding protein